MRSLADLRPRHDAAEGPATATRLARRAGPYFDGLAITTGTTVNTTKILRHINAMRCLRLLRTSGSVSRADLARLLGLNRSTTGYAIAELLDVGLVVELEEQAPDGRKGRPGVRVALSPSGAYAIGIDVGTREISGVLIDLQMGIVAQLTTSSGPAFRNPEAVLPKLVGMAQKLPKKAGVDTSKILGIGISIPGLVDHDGKVINAPFLEWSDFDLEQRLQLVLPSEWRIEVRNDADCFAAAECAVASPSDLDNFMVLLLAEGIGSALVSKGVVMQGAHGHAGEVGHTLVRTSGDSVTLERVVGAFAFSEFFAADCPVSEGVAALIQRQKEPGVKAALKQWAANLGLCLVNSIHVLDPGRIVLGGALAQLYPLVADLVAAFLARHLLHGVCAPPIQVTRFGKDGAAIGAAAVVRESVFDLPRLEP